MVSAAEVQQIRDDLTADAAEEVEQLAAEAASPAEFRAALFMVAPALTLALAGGAAALAADWYDDLRETALSGVQAAGTLVGGLSYMAEGIVPATEDDLRRMVAATTAPLWRLTSDDAPPYTPPRGPGDDEVPDPVSVLGERATAIAERLILPSDEELVRAAYAESLAALEAEIDRSINEALRETVTENTRRDPAADGWRREVGSNEACKFCRFLARDGAVYSGAAVRFAAHTHCGCAAVPSFTGQGGRRASVLQYVASKRTRTPAERARLREHLNANFATARG